MLRAIAFDIGGVVVPSYMSRAVPALSAATGIASDTVTAIIRNHRAPLERREVSEAEFLSRIALALGVRNALPEITAAWRRALAETRVVNPDVERLAPILARTYSVGCLSDTHEPLASLNRAHGVYRFFSPCFLSCEKGVTKASPTAFTQYAALVGCAPEEILLIDDKESNVAAARTAGWLAIQYRYGEDLAAALTRAGVAIPADESSQSESLAE